VHRIDAPNAHSVGLGLTVWQYRGSAAWQHPRPVRRALKERLSHPKVEFSRSLRWKKLTLDPNARRNPPFAMAIFTKKIRYYLNTASAVGGDVTP
jgi:hypothetical protein